MTGFRSLLDELYSSGLGEGRDHIESSSQHAFDERKEAEDEENNKRGERKRQSEA